MAGSAVEKPNKECLMHSTAVDSELGSDNDHPLKSLGYNSELKQNRSLYTLLFQTLAIAAIPFAEGAPLLNAIYGGGQLPIFIGWLLVLLLDQCVALSLSELASRYPTSAGPYYWSFQMAQRHKLVLSFITGWIWLIGNWTITLSASFGFAQFISAIVTLYHPTWVLTSWQLLLIFYAVCISVFFIVAYGNRFLPIIDTVCAAWTAISIITILVALSVKADAGRHSISHALTHYNNSLSGWGDFSFFIGLLPAAFSFAAIGLISSMAEEVSSPSTIVPRAISLSVPVGGIAGLFFILPICFTLPPLEDIIKNSPNGQALPYIFRVVMGSPSGALGLMFLVLGITLFCNISITTASSRTTYAFARDNAIPFSSIFSRIDKRRGVPINALALVTIVQMLLGLLNLGSSNAFTSFVAVGVIALAVSYAIPIGISLWYGRREVMRARWNCGAVVGPIANVVALVWIAFEVVLFSMPASLPVTARTMTYASVVFGGILAVSLLWFAVHARKYYKGPPASDGI